MRALLVCPGRGSYGRTELGQLQDRSEAASAVLDACDALRASLGRPTIRSLDGDERYQNRLHVAGEHASLLTAACTLADAADLADRFEVVGVVGNSMGFYTALAVSGALPLPDTLRLVETMGAYQQDNVQGGQLLYPLTGPDWRRAPERLAAVEAALAATPESWWSIDLGSYAVLGAADPAALQRALPAEQRGAQTFPVRLPLHSAFHTPLMQATSQQAFSDLGLLPFGPPRVPLVDGRGVIFRPRWASPDALRDYTLGTQVVAPFDFRTCVLTALAHTAPDVVVALGPGNSLGAPLAALLVEAGWRGVRSRAQLEAAQGHEPMLLSFGVPEQRARLL